MASRITQKGQGAPLDVFKTSTDTSLETLLASRWDLEDGREAILVQAGSATTVAAGLLYQAPAIVANHQNIAVTAYTAATTYNPAKVTVTLGATAATANQYAGGYLVVNDNNGEGQTIKIQSHPAADASASLVITLADSPATALTTASEVCLISNPGNGVIINPATPTGITVGVGLYPIAASAYGFLISKGITSAFNTDANLTVGSAISPSNAVAGGVENGVIAQGFVGRALQAGVSGEYRTVFIDL
jgi:hypothetical protein